MRALRFVVVSSVTLAFATGALGLARPRQAEAAAPAEQAILARRYYEDGVAAADAKEWEKAFLAFAEAWKLKQHWQIAVNLGQAELRLGKYPDAAEHLAYYLREATELHPDDVKRAREWFDQATAKIGTLRLNVAPKGAQVFVDGKLVGTAPIEHDTYVEAGWHAVEARSGEQKALRQVEAPAGQSVDVALGVGGAVPTPRVDPKAEPAKDAANMSVLSPRTLIVAGGAAFSFVNIVVGAATAAASTAKGSEQDKLCQPSCPQSRETMNAWTQLEADRVSAANASVAAFVIGGLAAAGTVTAFVLMRPKTTPAAPTAGPVATLRIAPVAGGVVLSGSF